MGLAVFVVVIRRYAASGSAPGQHPGIRSRTSGR
jgi:hypothetical protein